MGFDQWKGGPGSARWFAVKLDRRSAPWAFSRGEPFRTIAALEMFATLLCLMVFGDAWPAAAHGSLQISGVTDNAGNTSVVSRLMTSKFPLVVILAEVAMQLMSRRIDLDLIWAPRNQNEEADALTNGETFIFDKDLEVKVEVDRLNFLVLPHLMKKAEDLYEEVKMRRSKGAPKANGAIRKKIPLRQSDPWG